MEPKKPKELYLRRKIHQFVRLSLLEFYRLSLTQACFLTPPAFAYTLLLFTLLTD